jgi:hypothetical protein
VAFREGILFGKQPVNLKQSQNLKKIKGFNVPLHPVTTNKFIFNVGTVGTLEAKLAIGKP